MNSIIVECLVKAFAVYAEIESMKVANKIREMRGEALAYGEVDFDTCRIWLEELSLRIRERGD